MVDSSTFVPVEPRWWVTNFGGMVVTGVVAARSRRRGFRVLFAAAAAMHVGEATYSYVAARRAGFTASAPRWARQTLGVGFPSVMALNAAIRGRAPATA